MGERWTIYCHTHVDSGRRYIGLTKQTMLRRWNRHVYSALHVVKGRGYFANAIRKYGKDAFAHEVLQACETLDEANSAEVLWIDYFKTQDARFGFNLARGGRCAPRTIKKNPWDDPVYRSTQVARLRSATWREHMNQPETKARMSIASVGRIPSEETRRKIGEAGQGRRLTQGHVAKLTGRRLSAATKLKIAEARRGTKARPESIEKAVRSRAALPQKTHCKYGHDLSDAYRLKNGKRGCRACNKRRCAQYRASNG